MFSPGGGINSNVNTPMGGAPDSVADRYQNWVTLVGHLLPWSTKNYVNCSYQQHSGSTWTK